MEIDGCVQVVRDVREKQRRKSNRSLQKVNDPRLWLLLCNPNRWCGGKIWLATDNDSGEWFACDRPVQFHRVAFFCEEHQKLVAQTDVCCLTAL